MTLFCTFDIIDLYTILPQEEALDILRKFPSHNDIEKLNTISADTIIELACIVLTENAFIYDKKYNRQILSGAMILLSKGITQYIYVALGKRFNY